jgi:hypothetical protein
MENHPTFHDYGHFSDHNQAQMGSIYDGLLGDNVAEGWSFEDPHYKAGLDDGHSQSVSIFESENSSAQSSFTADFISSQSSSHTALGYAGNSHLNLNWAQQKATEAYNWPPTSGADAVYTNFGQEINNKDMTAESPRATMSVPLYNTQPPQIISSPITFQQLDNERVEPSAYAPQQGFEIFPGGESGENPRHENSLYVPPTPLLKRTNSKTHIISVTAVKCCLSNPITPPPLDRSLSLSQDSERRNSIATFAHATTRRRSREKPISNATWRRSTPSTTHPRRNCPNVRGQAACARGQMDFAGETRCCNIRIECMGGGCGDDGKGIGRCCV